MIDNIAIQEQVISDVQHIVTTSNDLSPAIKYITDRKPKPESLEWSPKSDTHVLRGNGEWIVQQFRPEPEVRNMTELHIKDDAKLLYVLWRELDDNPKNITQLSAMIVENPTGGQSVFRRRNSGRKTNKSKNT
ncbi:hypothetical protein A2767_06390 [Candidatus Roizmanbacteria bacterium RIFCSPHIGHO2_01_FULL_35_10]|uniref:Uncharacterized protein n=1 Tax=Candidatus Roizmanbacteria bacterium RIFCSPLOWO2_01_FULL_35_13 TaxID=1802055 RepID=A0A1F7ID58_9BACT|nr:MAG: hypothetical protein A2767_06390 [Candidatus Roizmanbacteria bacterium RIFCSPHIGHO2_01_FULL_35_10]OGK41287.1 MAG: hypothetical protein A3A74_00285 [Candidatus Roizmanbacteria bacterium RIFCSPLOWO2_01_FULL_35_13]